VARFVGATNLLTGRLVEGADGRGQVEVLNGRRIRCMVPQAISDPSSVSVSIRPESIRIVPKRTDGAGSDDNCLEGRVSGVTFLGSSRRVDVSIDGVSVQVTTAADQELPADGEVHLLFASERAVALPGQVS
jgi:ABC-type Fe3+/spermidine/putrescine transport system ATPase subunit